MTLTLWYHPLSSYCHKVLIALYENATPFTPRLVDLGAPDDRAAFLEIWPMGRFPVLRDDAHGTTVPESSIIIEYLAARYPGSVDLVLQGDAAREVRLGDRFFDQFVMTPMQKIVGDRLRPEGGADPIGVAEARRLLRAAYGVIEADLAGKTWAVGEGFTMADAAAAPALFFADKVEPLGDAWPVTKGYLERLVARPSYARTLLEAEPFLAMFPG